MSTRCRPTPPSRHRALQLLVLGVVLGPLSACSSPSTSKVASGPSLPNPTVTAEPPATTAPPVPTPSTTPHSAAGSPSPGAETSPAPGASSCAPKDLTLTDADTVVTQHDREQVFVLRTTGPDCGLSGYPTVTLRDAAGKPLLVTYSRGGFGLSTAPAAALTLSRATSASFSVATSRVSPCADAATISVVLPGTSTPLTARTTARVCQGRAGLSPVRRLNADS